MLVIIQLQFALLMKKSYNIAWIILFLILASCGSDQEVNQASLVESNQSQLNDSMSGYQTSEDLLNILEEGNPLNEKSNFESLSPLLEGLLPILVLA